MKVLSFNTGYFLDYRGTHLDYIKHPLKSIKGSKRELENLDRFVQLVEAEDPDMVLVQEVDGGSIRTNTSGQQKYLNEQLSGRYRSEFAGKYRGTLFPRSPVFRHMGNMVFFRKGEVENHALKIGRKNLVQEIRLEDFSVFSLHLSTFGGWIRKEQIKEIKNIAEKRQDYMLAGDLNLHKGRKEIEYLQKTLGNPVSSPGKTFPARNPERKLDLVASSEGLKINNLEELGNHFSDHRPVKFEVERN